MASDFPKVQDLRGEKREDSRWKPHCVLPQSNLKVTYHNLCHILLVHRPMLAQRGKGLRKDIKSKRQGLWGPSSRLSTTLPICSCSGSRVFSTELSLKIFVLCYASQGRYVSSGIWDTVRNQEFNSHPNTVTTNKSSYYSSHPDRGQKPMIRMTANIYLQKSSASPTFIYTYHSVLILYHHVHFMYSTTPWHIYYYYHTFQVRTMSFRKII